MNSSWHFGWNKWERICKYMSQGRENHMPLFSSLLLIKWLWRQLILFQVHFSWRIWIATGMTVVLKEILSAFNCLIRKRNKSFHVLCLPGYCGSSSLFASLPKHSETRKEVRGESNWLVEIWSNMRYLPVQLTFYKRFALR